MNGLSMLAETYCKTFVFGLRIRWRVCREGRARRTREPGELNGVHGESHWQSARRVTRDRGQSQTTMSKAPKSKAPANSQAGAYKADAVKVVLQKHCFDTLAQSL